MRFEQILTSFHLNDNTQCIVPQDRLSKIKPLLDYIIPKYQAIYIPTQELALVEAMVPFRGRISFRTYNSAKITKYGILIRICFVKVRVGIYATLRSIRGKAKSCKKLYCRYWGRTLIVGITYTRTITITAFLQPSYYSEEKH